MKPEAIIQKIHRNGYDHAVRNAGLKIIDAERARITYSCPLHVDPGGRRLRLLTGQGRYSDDLNLPGQLYGVMVRSRVAHGTLQSIDVAEAREMPGVRAVITESDLTAAGIKK